MSEYLDKLKADMADAERRLHEAHQKMQAYQNEFQSAQQDFVSFQRIVTRVEAAEKAAEQPTTTTTAVQVLPASQEATTDKGDGTNKTKLIRDALRDHPAGVTPAELFDSVKEKVGRAYLYAVLKRLRDNEEVMVRRKKYYLRPTQKVEDAKETATVQ